MKHVESLAWGWWKDPPDTLGDKRNFLLNKEELLQYHAALQKLHVATQSEGANVTRLLRAYDGKVSLLEMHARYADIPKPVTLASVMEHMLYIGKEKLAILHLLNDMAVRCRKRIESEEAQNRG